MNHNSPKQTVNISTKFYFH